MRMDGKIALVTGGASGIGRASCRRLAEAGAMVIVADRQRSGAEETAALITANGGSAEAQVVDVTRSVEIERLVRNIVDRHGHIDVLHANAGVQGKVAPIQSYAEGDFDDVMNVNVKGVFLLIRYVAPVMISQRGGSIVVTCSIAALGGVPNLPAYVASKHAALGLVRAAACDLAHLGVRVNAVSPGAVQTPMLEEVLMTVAPRDPAKAAARFAESSPMGRLIQPEEIADAVFYLFSDAARSITGTNLVVDAGRSSIVGAATRGDNNR
jgi:NAD(P)-dependent dehydrogenase (short-subunit alcohol dehydrogenase family)